jgi:hypothetical protein
MVWEKALVRLGRGCAGALFGAAFALGCASEEEATYHQDVAPILSENCVGCHRTGGIAPFSLEDYAAVQKRADSIADVTKKRLMPPMPVDNSGECNKYSNARWLSDREIETLGRWADAGAPEGDASARAPEPHVEPELEVADALISMAEEYTPNGENGHDDYRCFVIPAPVSEAQYLTAFQVIPGDARVVHHVIVYQPYSDDQFEAARLFDEAEDGPGYTCFGSPLVDAAPFALWAPGVGRMDMPAGTGVRLAENRGLVMQVHYNHENGAFPDQTSVKLKFAEEPVIPGEYLAVANGEMMLPPGRELVESSATEEWPEGVDLKFHGALPHMHTLGRTMRVEAEASGETRCLVSVDRWDFHWQNAWWYKTPLDLRSVRSLSISCGFDTRSRTETVTWGDSTRDEMCISYFYVTTQAAPPREINCENAENPLFGTCVQTLLAGCFEPDVSGECSVDQEAITLTWADGSKLVQAGEDAGFYGPGDDEPCAGLLAEEGRFVLTNGGAEAIVEATDDGGVTLDCGDGSKISATQFEFVEYGVCAGLLCVQ